MKMHFAIAVGLVASFGTTVAGQAASCPIAIGTAPVLIDGSIAFVTNGLQVDADGAPNSYLIDGNGLSETCDGAVAIVNGKKVTPSNDRQHWYALCRAAWAKARQTNDYSHVSIFGFLTGKNNVPLVQGPKDPLPDKGYISATSMPVPGSAATDQRHWVDATKIPYYVLPGSNLAGHHINYGDVAVIYAPALQKTAFAVFADSGPARGEASVKLHLDLGHNPIVSRSGVDRAKSGLGGKVVTLVFPGAATRASSDAAAWNQEIQNVGTAAFQKWGGVERLKACTK